MADGTTLEDGTDGTEESWQQAFDWVERNVGGRIVRRERHERWRPGWFIDVESAAGETLSIYFRGDRGESDHGVYPLEHEMRVLQLLEAEGIPVPHVYGFCEEPRGIVMERVAGRANLATAESQQEREAVLDQYMDVLARIHSLDTGPFEGIGLECPTTPEALGLGDFANWEPQYRGFKCRPEPLIEFAIRWIKRNTPKARDKASLLCCDSGQFLFDAGKLTCVLDLELAYLGDPAADIAGLMCRDLSEPLGDLTRAVRRYEQSSGCTVDPAVVYYHTIRFGICTPMVTAHLCAEPFDGLNFMQYFAWYQVYGRVPIELIARLGGVELEAPELPEPTRTDASPGHAALIGLLGGRDAAPEALDYDTDTARRVALYLERADLYGPALAAEDMNEVAAILGRRPADRATADAELEAFILEAGPERDAELVRYLYRRTLRQEALAQPAMRELEGARVQLID